MLPGDETTVKTETEGHYTPPPKDINSPNTSFSVSPQLSGLYSDSSPGPSSHIPTLSQHSDVAGSSKREFSLPPSSTSMDSAMGFPPLPSPFPAPPYLDKFSTPHPITDSSRAFSPPLYSSGTAPFPHFGWDPISVPQTLGMPVRYYPFVLFCDVYTIICMKDHITLLKHKPTDVM